MIPMITDADLKAALAEHLLPGVAEEVERSVRQHALKRAWEEQCEKVAQLSKEVRALNQDLSNYQSLDEATWRRKRAQSDVLYRKQNAAEKRADRLWAALEATWKEVRR